jgi:predicted RNA-binding Zn-ribbon protein involved in translation (DUF1610 family)
MDESKKKPIMIGVIVVCLVAAGLIAYQSGGGKVGKPTRFKKEPTWVICRNPNCKAQYEISKWDYFDYIEKNADPRSMMAPALPCEECGEESVYRAAKCEKEECGLVFEVGWKRGDYEDRCPKCGHSQIERERKDAAAKRRAGG